MKNTNRACKMYESDCVINPNCTWLAASPDGIVVQEDVEYWLVEVKCSYHKCNVSPRESWKDSTFFCQEVNGKVFLKDNRDSYSLVQGQLCVSGATYCDCVLYTNKGFSIKRITFDVVFWRTLTEKLAWVFFFRLLCASGENHQAIEMCSMLSAYNGFIADIIL